MKVTGTIINYYFHCKRQCWLHGNRLNLEDNSEDVRIGKVLHELKYEGKKNSEVSIDNVKIDKLTEEYLIEMKKSDADTEATKWQTLLYLKILKNKGVEKKGKIEYVEKNKQNNKTVIVELTEEDERRLEVLMEEIMEFMQEEKPPIAEFKPKCKKCAYFEYCFI
ncbi:CRISPR-associated protein Cas4 [Clostridium sp. 19966]|uniref:CRISPR-associated protein Cas4 n=1 Tax=Clostridium sp. 19966 TaxID=2768166 RepID=UPI0028DD55D4|nr:CRISPR-associated protein Cas4 [Clostridium sp. 19966]MDT8719411.1 CRISPR-associated protein Cas4 [Clostridium sp. 19966]